MKQTIRSKTFENPRLEGGDMTIDRFPVSMPGFATLPLVKRIAWRLRWWADKIDRGRSYSLHGMWPSGMTDQDLYEAFAYGVVAMQTYMTDIQAERRIQ